MLEVGLGNPAQQIGETGGEETLIHFCPLREADARQEFVGIIAGAGAGADHGFVNGFYQRVIDSGLGADIC